MIFCRISSPYDSRVPSCTDVFLQHTAGEAWQGRFIIVVGSLEKAQDFWGDPKFGRRPHILVGGFLQPL
jgi:hypothetical protein